MPERVKCLHVLVAHSLAAGPGVNPFGDEALAAIGDWGERGPCVRPCPAEPAPPSASKRASKSAPRPAPEPARGGAAPEGASGEQEAAG